MGTEEKVERWIKLVHYAGKNKGTGKKPGKSCQVSFSRRTTEIREKPWETRKGSTTQKTTREAAHLVEEHSKQCLEREKEDYAGALEKRKMGGWRTLAGTGTRGSQIGPETVAIK